MTGLEEMDLGSSNTLSGSKVVEDAVPGLEKDGKNEAEIHGFGTGKMAK